MAYHYEITISEKRCGAMGFKTGTQLLPHSTGKSLPERLHPFLEHNLRDFLAGEKIEAMEGTGYIL